MVGFLGSTGSGKTTVVNALLGMRDLLPSTTGRACTAVVVEVSYNKNEDAGSRFRAEVVHVTEEDWRAELEQLFQDLQPQAADDDDEETGTDERSARMNQAFEKVKVVYPHIKTLDGLKATSVASLLAHVTVAKILGSDQKIAMKSKKDFSAALQPYVDSGCSNAKTGAIWPLVKLVKVFVKAPILEVGITLVDLPGNSDSNAARSAVAATYLQKLSVTCILGSANRGIDEKNVG